MIPLIDWKLLARFGSKIWINPETGCWEWIAGTRQGGYAHFAQPSGRKGVPARSVSGHRWSYLNLAGPIADGLHLDHLCRVRHCVNPDHLEPVTCGENIRRGDTGRARGDQILAQTHCPQGHPYSGDNLRIRASNGARQCKTCRSDNQKRRLARRRLEREQQA